MHAIPCIPGQINNCFPLVYRIILTKWVEWITCLCCMAAWQYCVLQHAACVSCIHAQTMPLWSPPIALSYARRVCRGELAGYSTFNIQWLQELRMGAMEQPCRSPPHCLGARRVSTQGVNQLAAQRLHPGATHEHRYMALKALPPLLCISGVACRDRPS